MAYHLTKSSKIVSILRLQLCRLTLHVRTLTDFVRGSIIVGNLVAWVDALCGKNGDATTAGDSPAFGTAIRDAQMVGKLRLVASREAIDKAFVVYLEDVCVSLGLMYRGFRLPGYNLPTYSIANEPRLIFSSANIPKPSPHAFFFIAELSTRWRPICTRLGADAAN